MYQYLHLYIYISMYLHIYVSIYLSKYVCPYISMCEGPLCTILFFLGLLFPLVAAVGMPIWQGGRWDSWKSSNALHSYGRYKRQQRISIQFVTFRVPTPLLERCLFPLGLLFPSPDSAGASEVLTCSSAADSVVEEAGVMPSEVRIGAVPVEVVVVFCHHCRDQTTHG